MKVLILNLPEPPDMIVNRDFAGGFGSGFQRKGNHLHDVFPPLFGAYATSILEQNDVETGILDLQEESICDKNLLQKVTDVSPEVVVCRLSMPSLESDLAFISLLKEKSPETLFIAWGSICKVLPNEVLKNGSVDLVIRTGELDVAVLEMIDAFTTENYSERLKQKADISFREHDRIVHNQTGTLSRNLDAIPLPAYHLLDMKKYVAVESHYTPEGSDNVMMPFFTVGGSRGCSFGCMYCPYPVIFGAWRGRSPEKIVDEMECLVNNYNVSAFWFYDQTFSMDVKRSIAICDEIIARNLDVYWACETRADKIPLTLIKRLKKAGCTRVQLGIETGDPDLLKRVGKPGGDIGIFEKNIQNLKDEHILTELNFIVGLPGQTWRSIFKTAKFLRRVKPAMFSISLATPYPGTPLYEMAAKEKWLLTSDWKKYSLSCPVMSLPSFSNRSMRIAKYYLYYQTLFANMLGSFGNRILKK